MLTLDSCNPRAFSCALVCSQDWVSLSPLNPQTNTHTEAHCEHLLFISTTGADCFSPCLYFQAADEAGDGAQEQDGERTGGQGQPLEATFVFGQNLRDRAKVRHPPTLSEQADSLKFIEQLQPCGSVITLK